MVAKLYWATDRESREWDGPHESVEACKQAARTSYRVDIDGSIWVAPIDPETDDDDRFWDFVADAFLSYAENVSEDLVESGDGWLDPEEPWLRWGLIDRDRILAKALREVLGPRPEYRTVDTAKAERVEL